MILTLATSVSAFAPASALAAASLRAAQAAAGSFPGEITIGGTTYGLTGGVAVVHGNANLEGEGIDALVNKRQLTVTILKSLLPSVPAIGTKIEEGGITWELQETAGHDAGAAAWLLRCIQSDG